MLSSAILVIAAVGSGTRAVLPGAWAVLDRPMTDRLAAVAPPPPFATPSR